MGEPTDAEKLQGEDAAACSVTNPLIELHSVVDADSSQIEAIEMAKSGKSFVLQGPPGTGKSQTITNIIAECLGDGKKVLFVSEKLAALNVVYDKLKQAGLSEFCLQLHSHKANKKAVIKDICDTLRAGKSVVSSKADTEVAIKERAQRQLDSYAFELHRQRPGIEKSLYQMYESFAALRAMPDVEYIIPQLTAKGEAYLTETSSLLAEYVDYIPSVGYDYRKNPWYGYIRQDISYQAKIEIRNDFSSACSFLQRLIPLLSEVSEKFGVQCASMEDAYVWRDFFDYASSSEFVTPMLLNRSNFDAVNAVLYPLQDLSSDILSSRSVLNAVFEEDIYKLNGAKYHKALTKRFEGTFSRLFNDEYKKLISDLRACKIDGKRLSYHEAVALTERLACYQQKSAEYTEIASSITPLLGKAYVGVESDWEYIIAQAAALEAFFTRGISFGALQRSTDLTSERETFADYHQKLYAAFAEYDAEQFERISGCFDQTILNIALAPCRLVLERLSRCVAQAGGLRQRQEPQEVPAGRRIRICPLGQAG